MFRGDSSMNILEPLSSGHYAEEKQSKRLEFQQRKEDISASGWALGKGRRKTALAIARIRERTWPFRLDEIPQALQLPGLERVREVAPLFTTIAGNTPARFLSSSHPLRHTLTSLPSRSRLC